MFATRPKTRSLEKMTPDRLHAGVRSRSKTGRRAQQSGKIVGGEGRAPRPGQLGRNVRFKKRQGDRPPTGRSSDARSRWRSRSSRSKDRGRASRWPECRRRRGRIGEGGRSSSARTRRSTAATDVAVAASSQEAGRLDRALSACGALEPAEEVVPDAWWWRWRNGRKAGIRTIPERGDDHGAAKGPSQSASRQEIPRKSRVVGALSVGAEAFTRPTTASV